MAVKAWLQDRWSMLFPLLQAVPVNEEDIKRLCEEELEYWRSVRGLSLSSMRGPITATRNEIRKWPLTGNNSWLNPRTREREHIALKYMNLSIEEWAEANAPSEETFQARLEDVKFIESPDAVVAKAADLLKSEYWYDIACGLAVLVGRRYEELIQAGELFSKTLYSVTFKGQLKRRDEILPPYEIPTLIEASLVLDAWGRLRSLVSGSAPSDGRLVSEAAQKHFSSLVPARSGGDLYTHLFRSVYGCIAVFYYAPAEILAIRYLATIYGHYWVLQSTGKQQHNYITTLHYQDYAIGDAAIAAHNGKRQGVRLGAPGVEVLEVFRDKPVVTAKRKGAKMTKTEGLATERASQTGYSMLKPKQDTKERVDQIISEEGLHSSSLHDEVLRLLVDEHYQLKQFKQLHVDLGALAALLADAASDNSDAVGYLAGLLTAKREFKKSYEKRHQGKDYTVKAFTELREKTTEAAYERFRRGVAAIMAYNADVVSDSRWFINPKSLTDLVGGKPALASTYLESRQEEIDAHHKEYGVTHMHNRRPAKITDRLRVPDAPNGPAYELATEETAKVEAE
jgi:hypothetical protein